MSEKDSTENRQEKGGLFRTYYRTWRWRKDYEKVFGKLDGQFEQRVRQALDYLDRGEVISRRRALTRVREEEKKSSASGPASLSERTISKWRVAYRKVFGKIDGQFEDRLEQARLLLDQGQAISRYQALLRVREMEDISLDQASSQLEASSPVHQEEKDKEILTSPKLVVPNRRTRERWRSDYRKLFGQIDGRFNQRVQLAQAVLDRGQAASRYDALLVVYQLDEDILSQLPSANKPVQVPGTEAERINQLEADLNRLKQEVRALQVWQEWTNAELASLHDTDAALQELIREIPIDRAENRQHLLLLEIKDELKELKKAVEAAFRRS